MFHDHWKHLTGKYIASEFSGVTSGEMHCFAMYIGIQCTLIDIKLNLLYCIFNIVQLNFPPEERPHWPSISAERPPECRPRASDFDNTSDPITPSKSDIFKFRIREPDQNNFVRA